MENPAWRHVTDLKPLDTDEGKVLKITFELTDYDQTARIRWDEASGKFIDYKIKPGEFLKSIMREFLSKDYFSEFVFKDDETKGEMKINVVKNVREFKTWYEDARYNFDSHAEGVAGNMLGDAILLKKYKELFGIQGETVIDETGQNLGDYVFDEFVKDEKRILWCSEWKTRYGENVDVASELSRAKNELLSKRVEAARNSGLILPDYGYAFVVKITENYVEIWWEKVEIPKS